MDKLENGIKKISLNDISYDNFIQNFSKLNLNELKLNDNKELLVGYLPFKIKKPKIYDKNKQYLLSHISIFSQKKEHPLFKKNCFIEKIKVETNNIEQTLETNIKLFLKKVFKINNKKVKYWELIQKSNILILAIDLSNYKNIKNIEDKNIKEHKIINMYEGTNKDYKNIFESISNIKLNRNYLINFIYEKIRVSIRVFELYNSIK